MIVSLSTHTHTHARTHARTHTHSLTYTTSHTHKNHLQFSFNAWGRYNAEAGVEFFFYPSINECLCLFSSSLSLSLSLSRRGDMAESTAQKGHCAAGQPVQCFPWQLPFNKNKKWKMVRGREGDSVIDRPNGMRIHELIFGFLPRFITPCENRRAKYAMGVNDWYSMTGLTIGRTYK